MRTSLLRHNPGSAGTLGYGIIVLASAQLRTPDAAETEVENPAMTGLPGNMTEAIAELAFEVRTLREGGGGTYKDGGIAGQHGPYANLGRPALAPLEDRIGRLEAQISEQLVCKDFRAPSFEMFPADRFEAAIKKLEITIQARVAHEAEDGGTSPDSDAKNFNQERDNADLGGDQIPH